MFSTTSRGVRMSEIVDLLAWCRQSHGIVFYAETSADWAHFGDIISHLQSYLGVPICYLTSDPCDPVLRSESRFFRARYVGTGITRTWIFQVIKARVVVMTLPDLNRYHLKRSFHQVHYVYTFHSVMSTHMTYRRGAFDAFDSILCVGPHHLQELVRAKDLYSLPKGKLVECGHPRLDRLVEAADQHRGAHTGIVVAPTWGPSSFIEQPWAGEVLEILLTLGLPTTLRFHPMTIRHHPDLPRQYKKQFQSHPTFSIQTDVTDIETLLDADVLVTDWSGTGLEFVLSTGRLAVFIDTPRKINNPEYEVIGHMPLELRIRRDLGYSISPSNVRQLPDLIRQTRARDLGSSAEAFRGQWIYNNGTSARVAADYICSLL
jgi:hypothetical protein